MRTMRVTIIAIAVLAFVSCQKELVDMNQEPVVYRASMESFSYPTKTQLGTDNSVVWTDEDCIMVYEGTDDGELYCLESSCAGSVSGQFVLREGSGTGGTGAVFPEVLAVYPYSGKLSLDISNKESFLVTGIEFPAEQAYSEHSFANNAFPMTALSSIDGTDLSFKNVGGILELALKGEYAVSKIMLTGNSGERISGDAIVTIGDDGIPSVEMSENSSESVALVCEPAVQLDQNVATVFYISLPPTDFKNGFKVVITDSDGYKAVKETRVRNTVPRSRILVMPEVSAELSDPSCETGEASDVTESSVAIYCSFANIPDGAECGLRLDWDGGEIVVPVNEGEGTHLIEISNLNPGTLYSYQAYMDLQEYCVEGQVMQFETESLQIEGVWTCSETYSNGTNKSYSVALYEDGSAELIGNSSYEYSSWSCKGRELSVSFTRCKSASANGLKLKVNIDISSNPMSGTGRTQRWSESWNTGSMSSSYRDLVMTKNGDACSTGDVENVTVASAVVNCSYADLPKSAVCGVILSWNGNTKPYYADGTDGIQRISVSDIDPGTTYQYWAFAEFDGKYVKGDVKEFTTAAMNLIGSWLCVETDSDVDTLSYTVDLNDDGTAIIHKKNFSYQSASWSSEGRRLNVSICVYTPPAGVSGGLYCSDRLSVEIEDPYNPVYGVGDAEREAINLDTLGGSTYYRKLSMNRL